MSGASPALAIVLRERWVECRAGCKEAAAAAQTLRQPAPVEVHKVRISYGLSNTSDVK